MAGFGLSMSISLRLNTCGRRNLVVAQDGVDEEQLHAFRPRQTDGRYWREGSSRRVCPQRSTGLRLESLMP